MALGEKIKEARKKAGLSQKELGEKIGVTQQAIGQFEKGASKPSIDTAQKIASALGVYPYSWMTDYSRSEYDDYIHDLKNPKSEKEQMIEISNRLSKLLVEMNISIFPCTLHVGEKDKNGYLITLNEKRKSFFIPLDSIDIFWSKLADYIEILGESFSAQSSGDEDGMIILQGE